MKLLALVAAAWLAVASPAPAAEVFRVLPGPMDGARVQTPWGDYVVLVQGNTVWVGTQKEYDDMHMITLMRDQGARELCKAGRHCGVFVSDDLPRIFVGNEQVAGIDVSVGYEVTKEVAAGRPKVSPGTEFAAVVWNQAGHARVRPVFIDRRTHASFAPYACGEDGGFFHCDYKVPGAAVRDPVALAFMSKGHPPEVLAAQSMAWLAHDSIASHMRELRRMKLELKPDDPDDAAYRDAARLHALDPSVPEKP